MLITEFIQLLAAIIALFAVVLQLVLAVLMWLRSKKDRKKK